jgi:peptidoglycan hydrolase CwlO-like protein
MKWWVITLFILVLIVSNIITYKIFYIPETGTVPDREAAYISTIDRLNDEIKSLNNQSLELTSKISDLQGLIDKSNVELSQVHEKYDSIRNSVVNLPLDDAIWFLDNELKNYRK